LSKVDRFTSNQDQNDERPMYLQIHFTTESALFVMFLSLSVYLSHTAHSFCSLCIGT